MNGSSPTVWLEDNEAPGVAAALWDHPGVRNLLAVDTHSGDAGADDTFDDIPGMDYSLFGTDCAGRTLGIISHVKRDHRVRFVALQRAKGRCARSGCGSSRDFQGFLDVHHILGADKSDRVWNFVALCPNCHREAHAHHDRDRINADLLKFASTFHDSAWDCRTGSL